MKKSIIKISLAFIIIATLVLIWLGLRLIDGEGTAPSYRFLAGREPVACKDVNKGSVDKCYTYSFEADFNDVCSNAGTELISVGFVDRTLPANRPKERDYWLPGKFLRGPIKIMIYNNHEYLEHPISKEGNLGTRDGWVAVEIMYWRGW